MHFNPYNKHKKGTKTYLNTRPLSPIGEKLTCEREFDNCLDKFAIKVVNNGETVGHLPHKFLKIAWYRCVFDFILVMIHGKLQIFFQMF